VEPKISLITSLYKAELFLEGFLKDVVNQTIFNECELILLNANSPENERDIIDPYLKEYDNIVYEELDEDPGVYAVWNIGIRMSKSLLLSNANVDDRRHPLYLEKHLKTLEENPDIDLAYADVLATCQPNETMEKNTTISTYEFPEYSFLNLIKYNMPHCCPVWRKSLHDKYGYFREDMVSAADFDMWLRAAHQGSEFKKINEILSLYYRNPCGVSTKKETLKQAVAEVVELREEYMKHVDYREFTS
jgi:glycosyltransferase involved in cell wall biosynthesis